MIDVKCFTIEWIRDRGSDLGCRNPIMFEKAIMAFQLLGHLSESGIPFQFKGGTSLLLRLNPLRRLSIDVDIVTQATPDEFAQMIATVGRKAPFVDYLHDEKRDRDLPPKKHFRVMYPSAVAGRQDHILLDVLYEAEPVPGCEPVLITVPLIETAREVRVNVPSVNHLLGDKLTAFAPTTIGILYHEERKTDIVKQLFAVGALFDAATDLSEVATAYEYMHGKQLLYRKATYTLEETLNDTLSTALAYCQSGLRGGADSDQARFIAGGVRNLQNHLVNLPFTPAEARVAAAKAACLCAWIQRRPPEETFASLRFDVETARDALLDKRILNPWAPLDRLKGGNPAAFHYWYRAQQIIVANT